MEPVDRYQIPELSSDAAGDLCRLIDGLELLDHLFELPNDAANGADGIVLGRFRLRRRLGNGRFGVVFLADDPVLHRQVVVKVPQPVVLADPELKSRFASEAAAAGRLDHPGIVPVYDSGEDRGLVYLAAGFVDGPTLAEWLAENPNPSAATAAHLVELMSLAVHHAHDRGVLHCDLKPANVLIEPAWAPGSGVPGVGTPRVTDFGLARLLDNSPPGNARDRGAGTPLYMAPEQAGAHPPNVTQRSDVYALGAILYELLAGRPPFPGSGKSSILRKAVNEDPAPISGLRTGVPRDLEAVCLQAIARDQSRRYATAAELAADLRRFLSGRPVRARNYGPAERVTLWARRRPEAAALILLAFVVLVVCALNIVQDIRQTRTRNVELTATLEREREQERLLRMAVESERSAHYRARLRRYAAVVAQAGECWKGGRIDLIRGQLAELEPQFGEDDPREFAWHYLSGRVPEQVILRGPRSDLDCVAVEPRGRLLAAGGDGSVVIWDLTGGNRMTELGRVEGQVAGICFSPDGRRLAAAWDGQNGSRVFRVWDIAAGHALAEHLEPVRLTEPPAFSEDGRRLYYIRRPDQGGSELVELDVATSTTRTTSREATPLMMHHRSDLGVIAVQRRVGRRNRVIIEQRPLHPGSRPRPELAGLPGSIHGPSSHREACLAYSHDGALVAAVSVDGTVIVWDSATGRERVRGKVPPESVRNLAFSPDGRTLAVAWSTGPASRVDWWDVESGKSGEPIRPTFAVRAVAFTSDRTLAIGLGDGSVRLWSLDPSPPSRELRHGSEVWAVAFSPDGSTLASGGDDHAVRLWDIADGTERKTLVGHQALVMSVAYTPDGLSLVTGGFDGAVRMWDVAAGSSRALSPAHTAPVTAVAVSPDGRIVASRGRDLVVRLWDAATHQLLRELPCTRSMTGSLAFTPSSAILAVASGDKGVQLWDIEHGTLAETFPDPDYTWSVAMSADGRTLAIGSANGEVRLYDLVSRELRGVLLGHEGGVRTIAFSPDGRTLATGSDDHTVRLWHVPTAQPLLVLRGHQEKVFAVQFSREGRGLASGSYDGTVRLWQAADK